MQKSGYWDINTQQRHLSGTRMVDCGDVDIAYNDQEQNFTNITENVRTPLGRGALPALLGGDHSGTFPIVRAFEAVGPIGLVQIDAPLDDLDDVCGVHFADGSPMRRAAELPFGRAIVQLGIRDIRSREEHCQSWIGDVGRL